MALQSNKAGPSRSTLSNNHGGFEYDVFLSFRGEDTRHTFTGLFHYILELQGIHAYFDEEDLDKGERIEEILVAISRSKILVPIFSKRYAESHWCLREVAKMVESYDGGQDRRIIPIFFDVDPKDVRCQSGPFEVAFQKHQMERRDSLSEVDGWKHALTYVGGISGFDLRSYNGNQTKLIRSITADLQNNLVTKVPLYEKEYLVGLETRAEKMLKCLDFQSKHALIVGIHGIGGVGKTTLARAIYNRNRLSFGASSFIENVRKESDSGLVHLQKQLIQDICKGKDKVEINTPSQATEKIKQIVGLKTVLLVLDDVDDKKQLDALAGDISWFGPGSRIIITTRQVGVLQLAGLQEEATYRLEELDKRESLELFNHHAVGDQEPGEEYIKLSKEILSISSGIPLILEVFGSLFRTAKSPEEWNELLKDLRLRQHSEVHEKLRICYDRLNDDEKIIFLDIACLLISKSSEDAIYVWEDQKLSPHLAIMSLQNKSLIKITNGKFEMHDQIRDMGRQIVLKESPPHTGSYSRLWCEEDVMEALTKSQGSKIEGIILNRFEGSGTGLSTEAFELMPKLRILLLNSAFFGNCDFRHFPANLKWLEWKECPLEILPLESKFKSIVVLNLSHSFISQLWSETAPGSSSKSMKELFALKVLDLSYCEFLNATPNFRMAPNLKKLILDECCKLKEVDDSIGSLKQLVLLSMRGCASLEKLPNQIHEMGSLEVLNLEGCSRINAFPLFPPTNSTNGLSNLKELILRDCERLERLPPLHKFWSLRSLHIDGCQGLNHRRAHLFEAIQDVAFREWDELSVSGSQIRTWKKGFSFILPIGSINDPLLLKQLQCHDHGDPCENRTMNLHVVQSMTNGRVVLETQHEVHWEPSFDDVYGHCYTINFGKNDEINEALRSKTTIMKIKTSDTTSKSKVTKVVVKLQKSSKFSGENMKPFMSISRRESGYELSIFFRFREADKLDVIEYSKGLNARIDNMKKQLMDVQCGEQTLNFGWTLEELIILSLVSSDANVSWYEEQQYGTGLQRQASAKVLYHKIKVLNFSHCKFLVKTPDFALTPHLETLIFDHCECLHEIGESVRQPKSLSQLSIIGCAKLRALPCALLQLSSLRVLHLKKCSEIRSLPEASMTDVSLENLEQLEVHDCPLLTGIPDYVGQLRRLHHLSLRGCHSLQQLPVFMGNLVALKELILEDCASLAKLPDSIGDLKSLDRFSVSTSYRYSRAPIPHSIGRLNSLKVFICENGIIPGSIKNLESLLELSLVNCEFNNQPDSGRVVTRKMKDLRCLTLGGCKIPIRLDSLKCLKELVFVDLQVTELPNSIGHLSNLSCLTLKRCLHFQRLPDSVKRLTSLRVLCVRDCGSLRFIPQLPSGLKKISATNCPRLDSVSDLSNLIVLEELNVAECEMLAKIPGLRKLSSLKVLYMNGCRHLDLDSIGHLNNLSCLTLKRCLHVQRLPDSVKRLRSLRVLCVRDCGSLRFIPQLPSGLNKISATNCPRLESVSDLSNLIALDELNVAECEMLANIPGLRRLSSLKALYMNGCRHLDLDSIRSDLQEAAFDDLQAFSIGSRLNWEGVYTISLPFPRRRCLRNEPLQLEKMDVFVRFNSETMEDDSVLNVGVAVGPRLFPAARPAMALQLRAPQLREDLLGRYCKSFSYTARFGKDDEINKRLRVEATTANPVPTLHISCQDPMVLWLEADVWFRT